MKKAIALTLVLPLIALTGACERHTWEETKSLHKHGAHGDHGGGHTDHSDDGHDAHGGAKKAPGEHKGQDGDRGHSQSGKEKH